MKKQTPKTTPFSIRLTAEEKDTISRAAGIKPMGVYVRSKLLGDEATPRRKTRRPGIDQKQIALMLAELGKTRLASNMNQLAKAVNTGGLSLPPDVAAQLTAACEDIRLMRETLIKALGVKSESAE